VANTQPFLLLVDGKVTPCWDTTRAVYTHDGTEPKHNIEVHLTKKGVQVNIVDEENTLVETVHVHRGDKTLHDEFDGTSDTGGIAPETEDEALENVHDALLACADFGVPLNEIFTYLLSRAAEIAYTSAMSPTKFTATCMGVYEQVLAAQSESRRTHGEA
jgi:hypothetical protein